MDFNFFLPVNVQSGTGVVRKSADRLAVFGTRCLIVTGGKSAVLSGALDDVKAALDTAGVSYSVFNGIGPNPLLSACHAAGKEALSFGAQFLVGIGGGSALDGAKAAAVYAANPDFAPIDIYGGNRNPALSLVLIGTTAGTGSEIGKVSVLTNDETGRKKSISGKDLFPALTLADPRYTASMPYAVTVSTALDALSHAMEGYFQTKCGDIPALFAEKAVSLIFPILCRLQNGELPDEAEREQLYYGSLYAGVTLAFCGTAFPHPLGYVLTETFGTPHGFACAAFLPAFLERAKQFESAKTEKLLSCMETDFDTFCRVVKALTRLEAITMTEDEIAAHCARWNESIPNNFKFSPGGYTKADAAALLTALFCGKTM